MKKVRVRLGADLLAVVDAMRGAQRRRRFLNLAIRKGVRAIHTEAAKNAPKPDPDGGFGLAPLKTEGEAFYADPATADQVQALIDRLAF